MPKKVLKQFLPHQDKLSTHKNLSFFNRFLSSSHLWHINRQSIAKAMAIGLFIAFMPIPFQMVVACALAIILQANVALAIALVWITNPFTIPPILYAAYKIGNLILAHTPPKMLGMKGWDQWFFDLASLWQPIMVGLLFLALTSALLGYFATHLLWKLHIIRRWKKRKKQRSL